MPEQPGHHGVDGALLVDDGGLPGSEPANVGDAVVEIILASTTLQLGQLGVTADEIQLVLQMGLDGDEPAFDDQGSINVSLPMGDISGHTGLRIDGEVGLAEPDVGIQLKIEIFATLNGRGAIAGLEALAGIFFLGGKPQPKLPVVVSPVDNSVFEDEDFVLTKPLFLDHYAATPSNNVGAILLSCG